MITIIIGIRSREPSFSFVEYLEEENMWENNILANKILDFVFGFFCSQPYNLDYAITHRFPFYKLTMSHFLFCSQKPLQRAKDVLNGT